MIRVGVLLTLAIVAGVGFSPMPRWVAIAIAWAVAAYAIRIGAWVVRGVRAIAALAG